MTHGHIAFRDVVRSGLLVLLLTVTVVYVLFQARFLVIGPQVHLTTELPQRQAERRITLAGTTANISHLYLNGRPIYTNPAGEFTTDVILENGYTVVTITAADRYGRETTVTRQFVYTPMSFTTNP